MPTDPAGVYIHIPFCRGKCAYCSFASTDETSLLPEYLDRLAEEIPRWTSLFTTIDTLYIGGGTPSLLTYRQVGRLLDAVRRCYSLLPDAEVTLEINPADVTVSWLTSVREAGVNRISLGVQSFSDETLRFLGRRHSAQAARQAIRDIREAGFVNLSLDLIYGIPNQSLDAWDDTLTQALFFAPEHLSCYELSLAEEVPLTARLRYHGLALPDDDLSRRYFDATSNRLKAAGFDHYEVSNYAASDACRSRHNSKYWTGAPYLGLGASAHSFRGEKRWWNTPRVGNYVARLRGGDSPCDGEETLSREQQRLEWLMLGMRTAQGVNLAQGEMRFGSRPAVSDRLREMVAAGLVMLDGVWLKPTPSGLAVADALALALAEGDEPRPDLRA